MTELSLWYAIKRQPEDAKEYLRQAQSIGNQEHLLPLVARRWGRICEHIGDLEKAQLWYEYALNVAISAGIQDEVAHLYGLLGVIYGRNRQYDYAIRNLLRAINIAKDLGFMQLQEQIVLELSIVYEQSGDIGRALVSYKEYTELKGRILNQEKQKAITEMQTKFDVESAEREKELLRVKNEELQSALDEVRRLNETLTKLNDEKNEVLGIVAHDLKSPLAGVRMVASLVKDHYRRMPEAELEQQLETIVDSTERMLAISSNLLKAQQIETSEGFGVSSRIDVFAFVRHLAESYAGAAEAKQIRMDVYGETTTAVCSAEALRQAVENLVSNAVKFTPSGKRVEVRVQQRNSSVVIEVEDEGPGIRTSERRKLYRKYSRLSARPTGGESTTGLGLWIAKRAVEAMRGRLRCSSEPGRGATFRIELPLNA